MGKKQQKMEPRGKMVKELLAKGAPATYTDSHGQSLLHVAAMFNCRDIAEALIAAGADVSAKNAQGETPPDCAPVVLANWLREQQA